MGKSRDATGTISGALESLSEAVTRWTGTSGAFAAAVLLIAGWAAVGPVFRFSDTWQLVINTGTTIVTFLMVFLIQRSQNKGALAIHLKLNEIVAALEGASNRLVDAEDLSEQELTRLQRRYQELANRAARDRSLGESHSIDESRQRGAAKQEPGPDGRHSAR